MLLRAASNHIFEKIGSFMSVSSSNPSVRHSGEGKQYGVRMIEVTGKNDSQRVDNFLIGLLKGVPKSKIYRIIRKGEVRINKKRCKPETKLSVGDVVRVPPVQADETKSKQVFVGDALAEVLKNAVLY